MRRLQRLGLIRNETLPHSYYKAKPRSQSGSNDYIRISIYSKLTPSKQRHD